MNIKALIPTRALTDPEIHLGDIRVLGALCSYGDFDGRNCFPTQTTISSDLDISRQLVQRRLKKLMALGYIEITGQRKRHFSYRIVHDDAEIRCNPQGLQLDCNDEIRCNPQGLPVGATSGGCIDQSIDQIAAAATPLEISIHEKLKDQVFEILDIDDKDRAKWKMEALSTWQVKGATCDLILTTLKGLHSAGRVSKRKTLSYYSEAVLDALSEHNNPKPEGNHNERHRSTGRKTSNPDVDRARRRAALSNHVLGGGLQQGQVANA